MRGVITVEATEIFLATNSIRKNEIKKPSEGSIYQHLLKDEKHKVPEHKTFNQVNENVFLSRTFLTKADTDSFTSRMTIYKFK